MAPLTAWLMIVVSGLVLFAAFPGRYNTVLLPQFIGTLGIPFAIIFTVIQYAVAVQFRKPRVLWLVTGLFVTGAMLATIGRAIDLHGFFAEHNISYTAYLLCGGACTSGFGLGIAIVRGWVYGAD